MLLHLFSALPGLLVACVTSPFCSKMNRADEKRAFEAMMAEIDDDSDEDSPPQRSAPKRQPSMKATSDRDYSQSKPSSRSESKNGDSSERGSSSQANVQPKAESKPVGGTGPRPTARTRLSADEQAIENFGAGCAPTQEERAAEKLNVTKRWLTRPLSSGDRHAMKCFVERERSNLGLHVVYRCFLEGEDGQAPRFMMSAKKKVVKQSSYYLLSLDMDPDDDRGSEAVVGKIRGNAVGSRYIITDHGIAPDRSVAPSTFRKEFGVVGFEFDSGGPSKIDAWVPFVSASGVPAVWQPDNDDNGMEANIERKRVDGMIFLKNKTPKWDEAHGGHVLNFQGRVTESSVKNFQLCWPEGDDPDDVIMQFGRVGKHKFTLDLKFPLAPIQAFAIAVACLDGKIADRKGYELIKRITGSNGGEEKSGSASNSRPTTAGSGSDSRSGTASSSRGSISGGTSSAQVDGSMKGNGSLVGSIRESLPSGQYLRDRITRTFK